MCEPSSQPLLLLCLPHRHMNHGSCHCHNHFYSSWTPHSLHNPPISEISRSNRVLNCGNLYHRNHAPLLYQSRSSCYPQYRLPLNFNNLLCNNRLISTPYASWNLNPLPVANATPLAPVARLVSVVGKSALV